MTKTAIPAKARRESIYEKAARLVAEPERFEAIAFYKGEYWLGTIRGDHGHYRACAISPAHAERLGLGHEDGSVSCRCRAGRQGKLCSHALAAEEMRKQGEQS